MGHLLLVLLINTKCLPRVCYYCSHLLLFGSKCILAETIIICILIMCLSKEFIYFWFLNMKLVHLFVISQYSACELLFNVKHFWCVWSSYHFPPHSSSALFHLVNLFSLLVFIQHAAITQVLELGKVELKLLLCHYRYVCVCIYLYIYIYIKLIRHLISLRLQFSHLWNKETDANIIFYYEDWINASALNIYINQNLACLLVSQWIHSMRKGWGWFVCLFSLLCP